MVEITPKQAVVALSLASCLYLTEEEKENKDLSLPIQSPECGSILVNLARIALQRDTKPLSSVLARKHQQQFLVLQTRYDLNEGKLRTIEETALKLSLKRERTRQIETAAIIRIKNLEIPAWQAFKIFFLKTTTK